MHCPARRKPLAFFLFYGCASALFGGCPAEAQAAEALRVDPTLLGLPPVKPAAEPVAAESTSGVAPVVAEEPPPEARPVEPAAVEVKPVAAEREASRPEKPVPPKRAVAKEVPRHLAPPAAPSGPAPSLTPVAPETKPSAPQPRQGEGPAAPDEAEGASRLAAPATGARDAEQPSDPTPALPLRASRKMEPLAGDSDVPRPIFLRADRMDGETDRQMNAYGDAELRKTGTVANAERMTYWPIDDEIEAEGNVRLQQPDSLITGPKMRMKLEDKIGYFEQPSYAFHQQPDAAKKPEAGRALTAQAAVKESAEKPDAWWNSGFAPPKTMVFAPGQTWVKQSIDMKTMTEGRGTADRADFEGENQIRLSNATYTTCSPDNDAWYVRARDLKLDYDHEVGEAKDGTIYFMDTPILHSPWLDFPLNDQPKSGVLPPRFGASTDNGLEIGLPYYWSIAPNEDLTISPRLLSRRGVHINNTFRYIDRALGGVYNGYMTLGVLPDDQLRNGENRYGVSILHQQRAANGFSGSLNYSKVSDAEYYTDHLASSYASVASSAQTQLLQQGTLTYAGGGWWNSTINFQQYQTLQPDPKNPVYEQYRMLPQITLNARKPDFYLTDSSFLGQYTNFTKRDQTINGTKIIAPDANRSVLYPQVALPYVTPGWYVTPKVGVNYRHYALTNQDASIPGSLATTVPIYSIDSGMTLERSSNWFGRDYTQTLEPRLYYLHIPYRNQDKIPIFDSGLADFNFAQIFSENQFTGWDRINNANQLTAAVTSRLIEPGTGNEVMRAMLGQRFYFSQNRVGLTPTYATDVSNTNWDRSDLLAAFSGQILPRVYGDAAVQYNIDDQRLQRYSVGVRYQPEPGKTLNAAYRYNRDPAAPVDQVDLSGQWPLFGRWYGVGRFNYSFKDEGTVLSTGSQGGRIVDSIGGLEYDGGCWVFRGVIRRRVTTSMSVSTAFFVQLELSGFSRLGSNPLMLLKRSIPGYELIGQGADSDAEFSD